MTPKVTATGRDRELFKMLASARWLSTSQIGRCFFPLASRNAVQKRLRRLVNGGLLRVARTGRTDEQYVTMTRAAAAVIGAEVKGEKRLPAQLDHFTLINDVRIWFESQHDLRLERFWGEHEYRPFSTRNVIIPDAIVLIATGRGPLRFGIEVDCSTENAAVLAEKVRRYSQSTVSQELAGVLVWARGSRRLRAIAVACLRAGVLDGSNPVWLLDLRDLPKRTVGSIEAVNLTALAKNEGAVMQSLSNILGSPLDLSSREEEQITGTVGRSDTSPPEPAAMYATFGTSECRGEYEH